MDKHRFLPKFSIRSLFAIVGLCGAITFLAIAHRQREHVRHVDSARQIADAVLAAEHADPSGVTGALETSDNFGINVEQEAIHVFD